MIYHLLPGYEVFSVRCGAAITKDIACIMRFSPSSVVVCRGSDDSWGYDAERIMVIPALRAYREMRIGRFFPLRVNVRLLRAIFHPLLARLKSRDLVWCHNESFYAAALEQPIHLKGAKLLYHFHDGNLIYGMRTAFQSFAPDACIFVSGALRQEWLQRFPQLKNTHVVYNGVNENLFHPATSEEAQKCSVPTVLYVGRLIPEKGVHVLVDAMRILENRKVDALCRIVGSFFVAGSRTTPYIRSLQKHCPSNVQFSPYRSAKEIAEEYRAADICCCPSIWQEPFGNVNIEAMASGIPVVATRVGGIPEIAAEGGVILTNPNSAVELADALQKLIEDKRLRARTAAEGLKSVRRRFTWSVISKQYKEIVDSLWSPNM